MGTTRPEPLRNVVTWIAFLLSIGLTAEWLVSVPRPGAVGVASLIAVLAAHLTFVLLQRRSHAVSGPWILLGVCLLVVVAVVLPPAVSKDIWAYVQYGRITGIHHASAYTQPPSTFPSDPLLSRMNPVFLNTGSVYGPAFTAISGLGAQWYGVSPLRARLFFQMLAGAALVCSTGLLLRRGVSTWKIALVSLAPGVFLVVNDGHLDLIVGLSVLGALLLFDDERYALGALVLTFALLIKIVALPAMAGVLVALVLRGRLRAAAAVVGISAPVAIVSYVLVGGRAVIDPMSNASRYLSAGSIAQGLTHATAWTGGVPAELMDNPSLRSLLAVGLAAAFFGVFVWNRREDADVVTFAVAATLIYLLTTNYALAWYPLAILPASALVGARLRWSAFATFVLFQCLDHRLLPLPMLQRHTWFLGPLIEVTLLVLIVARPGRPSGAGSDALRGEENLPRRLTAETS